MELPAWLEAAGGDHLLPVSHLDGEGVEGPLQDYVGAIIEQRQGRHAAVLADQYMGGGQQLSRKFCTVNLGGSCDESTDNDFGTADQLHLLSEVIKSQLRLLRQLARKIHSQTEHGLGG